MSRYDLTDKVAVLTGGTSGIGRAAAIALAAAGARVVVGGRREAVTHADLDRVFAVNVWAVVAAMKHEVAAMLRTGGGAIVNTSSIAGHVGIADFSLYNASKHAVEGLTKTVALELAGRGIRVNAVAPAFVATAMVERFVGAAGERRK